MDSPTLKPCPFCGGDGEVVSELGAGVYAAKCMECDSGTFEWGDPGHAAAAWNRRPSPWISVEERLPENADTVLVAHQMKDGSYQTGDPLTAQYWPYPTTGAAWPESFGQKTWWDVDREGFEHPVSGVTHWMPLPEPPTE